jgi:hypothetical protein
MARKYNGWHRRTVFDDNGAETFINYYKYLKVDGNNILVSIIGDKENRKLIERIEKNNIILKEIMFAPENDIIKQAKNIARKYRPDDYIKTYIL